MGYRIMIRRIFFLTLIIFSINIVEHPTLAHAQSCSNGNGQSATINFVNQTDDFVQVFWVNFECQEQLYNTLVPAQSFVQPTYDGHEWVLRNMASQELGRGIGVATSETIVTATTSSDGTGVGISPLPTLESPLDFTYHPTPDFEWVVIDGHEGCEVRPTTPTDGLDPFYQKVCFYEGVPIASSNNVPDEALYAAWIIMANMLQGHSAVVEQFIEIGMIFGIVAEDEGITLLPQYAFLRNDPNMDWDARARGLGGNIFTPLGSGAEENLLCYDNDPYLGESIFLHEFAHTLKDGGIALIDPSFNIALDMAYQNAYVTGLWENTYALETVEEYWAEGVQSYFNTNLEAIPTNGIHGDINTYDELKEYDPTLFAIIDIIFGGFEWTPTCPE